MYIRASAKGGKHEVRAASARGKMPTVKDSLRNAFYGRRINALTYPQLSTMSAVISSSSTHSAEGSMHLYRVNKDQEDVSKTWMVF